MDRSSRHRPPIADCACGLYALHPFATHEYCLALGPPASCVWQVSGIIEAWGRVEVHETGFRAEFARPIVFVTARGTADRAFGRAMQAVADSYGAEVLERERADELVEHCARNGLGLSEDVVEGLIAPLLPEPELDEGRQAPSPTTVGPKSTPRPSTLHRVGHLGQLAAQALGLLVLSLVYLAMWAVIPVGIVLAILDDTSSDAPAVTSRGLRIADQALTTHRDELIYVAVVRNASEDPALGAFATGRVIGDDGTIAELGRRRAIENRPNLRPGASGVIVDVLPAATLPDLDQPFRYEVEVLARRPADAEGTRPAVEFSRAELEDSPCRIEATANSTEHRRRVGISAALLDRRGEIVSGGWTRTGPIPAGRSRGTAVTLDDRLCEHAEDARVFANPTVREVTEPAG